MIKLKFAHAVHEALRNHFAGRLHYATVDSEGLVVVCVDGERWALTIGRVDAAHRPVEEA